MTFKNIHLSVSRLERYEKCPRSFKLHYIDKCESQRTDALRFGVLVHAVLDRVYFWVKQDQYVGPVDDAFVRAVYNDEWQRSGLVGLDVYREGLEMLQRYFRRQAELDHASIVAVEHHFELPMSGYTLVGSMDRVERLDETTIRIVDYKTNRRMFSKSELDSNLQLSVYCMAAMQEWPWAKEIHLSLDLLRFGVRMDTQRSDEDLRRAHDYVIALARQTESVSDFPARISPLCAYCDHRARCNTYQAVMRGEREAGAEEHADIESAAREREHLAARLSLLKKRKDDLDSQLREYLQEAESENVLVDGVSYGMSQVRTMRYPREDTVRVIADATQMDAGDIERSILAVDNKRLGELLAGLDERLPRARVRLLKVQLEAIADPAISLRLNVKAPKARTDV